MRETEREREIEWFHVISQLAIERERESMGECVSEIGKREREREREGSILHTQTRESFVWA